MRILKCTIVDAPAPEGGEEASRAEPDLTLSAEKEDPVSLTPTSFAASLSAWEGGPHEDTGSALPRPLM